VRRGTTLRATTGVLLAPLLLFPAASSADSSSTSSTSSARAAEGCVTADTTPAWRRVTAPPQSTQPVSLQQLDSDPRRMLAADGGGRRWASEDCGVHWTSTSQEPRLNSVFTEGLRPRAGRVRVGGLLAGAAANLAANNPALGQVYASLDEGATFAPSRLLIAAGLLEAARTVDLHGEVLSAATAVNYGDGHGAPVTYVTARLFQNGALPLPGTASPALLKSIDGGLTFTILNSKPAVTPTVVAVSPTSTDEIWANSPQVDGGPGGVWLSSDGGQTFSLKCCAEAAVRDIAVVPASDGGSVVLLATDQGLKRSVDSGTSWDAVTSAPATGIRTAPDDPSTMVLQRPGGIDWTTGASGSFRPLGGLPSGCTPTALRRTDTIPPTFLVTCAGSGAAYRLRLTGYASPPTVTVPPPLPPPPPCSQVSTDQTSCDVTAAPLKQNATWALPGANPDSGAVAFSGTSVYYDMKRPGDIGEVRTEDGRFLRTVHAKTDVFSLSFDLKRNQLLITSRTGKFFGLSVATSKLVALRDTVYKAPSYDSGHDGLLWLDEYRRALYRGSLTGVDPGRRVCSWTDIADGGSQPSNFVASGDGGGYVQDEDDRLLFRLDRHCAVTARFSHRKYSESRLENDSMACDTQSYFPKAAVWIRDSDVGSVTSYEVPFGYCPMPSKLHITGPTTVQPGSTSTLCARLTNATTGLPISHRGVILTVAKQILLHQETGVSGEVCSAWTAPASRVSALPVPVTADFNGDTSLYPAHATAEVRVVVPSVSVPPTIHQPVVILPPPPPPPPPVTPPNPVPAAGGAAAPAQANAIQGQAQAQAQGQGVGQAVVVPERQQAPQLALARAVNEIGVDGNAMTRPGRSETPIPSMAVLAALTGICTGFGVLRLSHQHRVSRIRPSQPKTSATRVSSAAMPRQRLGTRPSGRASAK
jgi:hypothetical protein